MRWPWRRRYRASLTEIRLPYAQGVKIGRNNWRISVGEGVDAVTYPFWNTDQEARKHIQERNDSYAQIRAQRIKRARLDRLVDSVHTKGRHGAGPWQDCPRCKALIRPERWQWR